MSQVTRRHILWMLFSGITAYLPLHMLLPFPVHAGKGGMNREGIMNLPRPGLDGQVSVEKAMKSRRSIRSFSLRQLTIEQMSQILWSAQGITEEGGYKRSAASAGALYPIEVYAIAGSSSIKGLNAGIYHYEPGSHSLVFTTEGDHRDEIAQACLSQLWVAKAPLVVAVCADFQRITLKYGRRGERYVAMESGGVSQNIFLQAQAMGLAAGIVGAFEDADVQRILKTPFAPLLIMPVGYR
jgi:SagB-type dehydrogenase family enzyme